MSDELVYLRRVKHQHFLQQLKGMTVKTIVQDKNATMRSLLVQRDVLQLHNGFIYTYCR